MSTIVGQEESCPETNRKEDSLDHDDKASAADDDPASTRLVLLGLVLEFLAGSLVDVIRLARVNKRLHGLLAKPMNTYEDTCKFDYLWSRAGSVLIGKLLFGDLEVENERGNSIKAFTTQPVQVYTNSDFLVARSLESSPSRYLLNRQFVLGGDVSDLGKEENDDYDEEEPTMSGNILYMICYYLTRAQVPPLRLYRAWLASQNKLCSQEKDQLPQATLSLESYQLEEKLRDQVESYLEQIGSATSTVALGDGATSAVASSDSATSTVASSESELWGEFKCAAAETMLISQEENRIDAKYDGSSISFSGVMDKNGIDHARIKQHLQFLATALNYTDHQLVSSHDWHPEEYKYDLRVGCRVECTVLGKLGTSARFTMRLMSDNCASSADSHLECVVSLEATERIVKGFYFERRSDPLSSTAGVPSHRIDGINPVTQRAPCEKSSNDRSHRITRATAEIVAMGPGVPYHYLMDEGQLAGSSGLTVNGFLLELVARELGIPELPPCVFWDFLRNAMVPRIPNSEVDNHIRVMAWSAPVVDS
jgi:hypothetical protein